MDDIRLKTAPFISIHAPHEGERRCWPTGGLRAQAGFQSTLPTRGSDIAGGLADLTRELFQSTLPTRGSDANGAYDAIARDKFQSTLPTRGSDPPAKRRRMEWHRFQSTLPTRGSDTHIAKWIWPKMISIHAPHEGERLASLQ